MSPKMEATIEILHAAGGILALQFVNGYPHEDLTRICAFADSVIDGSRKYGDYYMTSIDKHTELGDPAIYLARAANCFLDRDYANAASEARIANGLICEVAIKRGPLAFA